MAFAGLSHGINKFAFVSSDAPFPSFANCNPFFIAPKGAVELVAPIL